MNPIRGLRTLGTTMALAVTLTAVPAALLVGSAPQAHALDNGLALTPPMGWNGWNAFKCDVDEAKVRKTADILVSSGLRDAGYQYVNLDDCWMRSATGFDDPTGGRDAAGRLQPDPVKFPNGIDGLARYVHAKGLKLGIYESAGWRTCAFPAVPDTDRYFPGSMGHEAVDAQTFADWGVDLVKYDNCGNFSKPHDPSVSGKDWASRFPVMGRALKDTGRPIVYSLCSPTEPNVGIAPQVGNMWRTSKDIAPTWSMPADSDYGSLLQNYHANVNLAASAGPGAWNDPDMLEIGTTTEHGTLTPDEARSQFSLWAVMAAPLIAGTDLRDAAPETLAVYGNRDVIAVDQDPLGRQGVPVPSSPGTSVTAKPLANGDVAVTLFNESGTTRTIATTTSDLGLPASPSFRLNDLWTHTTSTTDGVVSATVPPHATVMYRVSPVVPGKVALQLADRGGAMSAQVGDLATGGFAPRWTHPDGAGLTGLTSVSVGTLVHVYGVAGGRVFGEDLDSVTGSWSGWQEVPGGGTGVRDITASVVGNVVQLLIAGWDGSLWLQHGDYAAGHFDAGWTMLDNAPLSRLTSVAAGTRVHVYAIALGRVYGGDLDATTGAFGGWAQIPGGATGAADLTASLVEDVVHLEIVGGDGSMFGQRGDYGAGRFDPAWTQLPGSGLGALTSVAAGTRVHVYGTAGGQAYHCELDTVTGRWADWTRIPGDAADPADLTAAAFA
ncbi:glycoside hydrolase family 27 protein [Kitasatospora sp. NPDC091207]|uniref:glycoside hydrolase family 27 protein n=1 Tax=Kitasatospora sp. NPDC091207 TaxID=3364083 RepID=UPI003802F7DB